MKKSGIVLVLMLAGALSVVHAQESGSAVILSTAPESVAITGETVTAPVPQAMTDADQDGGVFVTLTRTAIQRETLPANAEVLTAKALKALPARTAGDAVETLTSVQIHRTGLTGSAELAGIRGASTNQTLVMIDGRPVGGVGLSASQDLSEIPVEQIERIEVVRGGVSALYGPNAIGGVINVVTKRAAYAGLPTSHLAWEGRSFNGQTLSLDAGSRYGPVDFFFFGRRNREWGFRNNEDANTRNFGGNVGLAMGKAGKLLLDLASYSANVGIPGQQYPEIPVNQYNQTIERQSPTPNARQLTNTDYGRASYLLPLPRESLLTLRAWDSERRVQYRNPDPFFPSETDAHERSIGGESQLQLPLGLLVGGTYIRDRLDNRDYVLPANNFIAWVENWGVFLQDEFSIRGYSLIPSIRFDRNSRAGGSTNPRIQSVAPVTSWLTLSASAARSLRAPTLYDLFGVYNDGFYSYQGDPNLKPEKAWTYDAGFELHEGSASFKVSAFRANVSDLIQTTAGLATTSVNIGTARRQGVEAQFRNVWTSWFQDVWNYTYLDNQGIPAGFQDYVELRLSPHHTLNYAPQLRLGKLSWVNTLRYVSASYENNNRRGDKINDHATWDTRWSYPVRQLDLYVGVNNVLGKRYRERSGYPLPGRTIYAGVNLRLWG